MLESFSNTSLECYESGGERRENIGEYREESIERDNSELLKNIETFKFVLLFGT